MNAGAEQVNGHPLTFPGLLGVVQGGGDGNHHDHGAVDIHLINSGGFRHSVNVPANHGHKPRNRLTDDVLAGQVDVGAGLAVAQSLAVHKSRVDFFQRLIAEP